MQMGNVAPLISFDYKFIGDPQMISDFDKQNIAVILAVDALFTVRVNGKVYMEAEIAILEFYKALHEWVKRLRNGELEAFHYYTMEYVYYERDAILSVIPEKNGVKITSIWAMLPPPYIFNLSSIVVQLVALEDKLRQHLEQYFSINLASFLAYIPHCEPI